MTAVLDGLDLPDVPDGLVASEPPETRGAGRDDVRMLVSRRTADTEHTVFRALPRVLDPGDLVVVNTSATIPAAVPTLDGRLVHLSTRLPGGARLVEIRRPHGAGSLPGAPARPGERLPLPAGGVVELLAPWPVEGPRLTPARLWLAAVRVPGAGLLPYLADHGRPIRYAYAAGEWSLSTYQTVFASQPGSAEMPSAGRPFTAEVVTALVSRGIGVSPIVLHTGVSSPEAGEAPAPEEFTVPAPTADRVNATHAAGGRVVAVGTTVTRALETVADERGRAFPGGGWTDLVLGAQRPVRVVDGLLTGWHPPGASHLALLEAVAGAGLLRQAHQAAVAAGYRWHEFGDLHLILP